jgi:SAM-dependent methyltransferase
MRLLDCGCGPGSITVGLAAAVAPGETIGLDLQTVQLERARLRATQAGVSNIDFESGSVYELRFPDRSFDVAFAHNLLLHLAEPLRALQEIRRVLRDGGVVGIADDDLGTWLWEPQTPALAESQRIFRLAVQHRGGDVYRARHHRQLLLQAGFDRPIAGATLGTGGVWGTSDDTRMLSAWLADQFRAPAFRDLVIEQAWTDEASFDAMIDEVLAWGKRPDSFAAGMGVTALGWARHP